MYISQSWLKQYLPDIDKLTPQTISEALTGTLAEVEKYVEVRGKLSQIVCGEVLDVSKLEGSDKLSICKVDVGESTNTIICGASNIAKGQKVAVCLIGGTVYNAHSKDPDDIITIIEKPMMGITSQGMVCSAKELALTDDHEGILVLEPDLKVGTDLVPFLKDTIYEIENKSLNNRPDCFSHVGIARELSAILNLPFVEAQAEPMLAFSSESNLKVEMRVEPTLCSRFTAIVLSDVEIKPSPLWLQAKLTAIGLRPVNNVVDITNYVMFDKGQPMHAYDYDKLTGQKLVIRQAKDGEILKALNGKEYSLTKDMMVISDDETVQDLAGIMGGSQSEVSDTTKSVVLEAANFNMYSIRKTSRLLGLRSEASTRFEKGQDPNNAMIGLKSALELLFDLTNSEISSELIDIYPVKREEHNVTFDFINIKRFLGIDISKQDVLSTFQRLRLGVIENEKITNLSANIERNELATVVIPTFRSDLNIENDLLEEIARMYGYAKIQPTLPVRTIAASPHNPVSVLLRRINSHLINTGANEVLTYTFTDPEYYRKLGIDVNSCVALRNPTSPELGIVRNTLIPSLITAVELNSRHYTSFSLFEINRIIQKELSAEGIPLQPRMVSFIQYTKDSDVAYFKAKGVLESLCSELELEIIYKPLEAKDTVFSASLHKYRKATIMIDGQTLGVIAEASSKILNTLNIKGRVGFFEIDFELLCKYAKLNKQYTRISVYPEVYRDLSFWLDENISYQAISTTIHSSASTLLKSLKLKDVFIDTSKAGKKSITISLCVQSQDNTLQDKDIDAEIASIVAAMNKEHKAILRDDKSN